MHDEVAVGSNAPHRVRVSGGCVIGPARRANDELFLRMDLDPVELLGPDRGRRLDPFSQFALVAVERARAQAGMPRGEQPDRRPREGVVVGTALAAEATCVRYTRRLISAGPGATNPIDFPDSIDGGAAGHVALDLGLGGPSLTFVDGQSSATTALLHAARLVAWGRAKRMHVVVGDRFDPFLGNAVARAPELLFGPTEEPYVPAECVVALVLERQELEHTNAGSIELRGFLDVRKRSCEEREDASVRSMSCGWAAPLSWQLEQTGTVRLLPPTAAGDTSRILRDPSGALQLSGAWLSALGSLEGLLGGFEQSLVGSLGGAMVVPCGDPARSPLRFIRV